jgi:hypothetical protein
VPMAPHRRLRRLHRRNRIASRPADDPTLFSVRRRSPSRLCLSHRGLSAMPAIDFAQVRRQVSMEQVLVLLNFLPSRRRGSCLRGPCPIHRSSTPQSRIFWVDLSTRRYRCFRCGSAGRQIDLWAAVHGLSAHQSAEDLCNRLGLPIPWLSSPYPAEPPSSPPTGSILAAILAKLPAAADSFSAYSAAVSLGNGPSTARPAR